VIPFKGPIYLRLLDKINWLFIGYCYYSFDVIIFSLAQSDHSKRFVLHIIFPLQKILGFNDKQHPAKEHFLATVKMHHLSSF